MKFNTFLLFILCIHLSCTTDRDLEFVDVIDPNENENLELLHYWNFNESNQKEPNVSLNQNASLVYLGDRSDRVDEGSDLNLRLNEVPGDALRLRNPSGDFIIQASTEGFKDILFSYAVMRTNNGPQIQRLSYSTDGVNYTQDGLVNPDYGVATDFTLRQFDFSSIEAVNNNENFSVKIDFDVNAEGESGNSRFDNISIDAVALESFEEEEEEEEEGEEDLNFLLMHYWNFNNSSSEEDLISPTFSFSSANLNYEGNFFDDTDGSTINARNDDPAGDGLRLRNPAGPFTISASTENYENVKISYAARRTNNGAQQQLISYSVDAGQNFSTEGLETLVFNISTGGDEEEFELFEIDLSSIEEVQNNPDFQLQINFDLGADNDSGNNRFDNLVIEGTSL